LSISGGHSSASSGGIGQSEPLKCGKLGFHCYRSVTRGKSCGS
jgi:hypothetical protein